MRLVAVLVVAVSFAGCSFSQLPPPSVGTDRVFAGRHVVGRYVSPTAYESYMRAQLAALAGDNQGAADHLRHALVFDGSSPYLHARLGEELMALGRLDEAREEVDTALRFDPDFAEAYVDQGRIALRLGDAGAAERSFRRAFAIDRTCEDAYSALATMYEQRGDTAHATQVWRALVDAVPSSAAGHFHLARAASHGGDLRAAEAELRAAMSLDPTLVDACRELGVLLIADGRAAEVPATLETCRERDDDVRVDGVRIDAEIAAGHADAAGERMDALAEHALDPQRRLAVAALLVEHDRAKQALALVAPVAAGGVPAALVVRGDALAALGRDGEAVTSYRAVPSGTSDFARAAERLASLLARDENFVEAQHELSAALAAVEKDGRADDADALVQALARVRERAGDAAGARHVLESALAGRGDDDALGFALARLLERAGEWQPAVASARALVKKHPDDAEALRFVAVTLAEHDTALDEARRFLERALVLSPTSGDVADSLGWLYLKLGRLDDAERMLARASRLLARSADVQAHLGDLYLRRGDRHRALDAYHRALAGNLDGKLRHTVEDQLILLEPGRIAGAR